MAPRTSSMVASATSRAFFEPSSRTSHTVSGRFANSGRRAWTPSRRSSRCSASFALQSRQPIPAVRQPAAAHSRVSRRREGLVQVEHGTDVGVAGVGAPLARRVGEHRLQLLLHRLRVVLQVDRVAVRLRHLAAVGPRDALGLGEQRLRLREDLAVQVVEAAHDLPRDLDVGRLVLAHRDRVGLVDDDVGGLQQRVAEEAVGREVLPLDVLLLLLVGRDALQPGHRHDHREQQVQLRVLRHQALDEQRSSARGRGRRPASRWPPRSRSRGSPRGRRSRW